MSYIMFLLWLRLLSCVWWEFIRTKWKLECEEILEVALVDSDQWVSMLAELSKSYPIMGLLNYQIEENASVFTDVANDLKKLVRKHSDQGLLQLECLYLNRNALIAIIKQLAQPANHFTLKQKLKSATLRAELLQKSVDAVSNLRKSTTVPSVPIRCRGLIKSLSDATVRPVRNKINLTVKRTRKKSPESPKDESPCLICTLTTTDETQFSSYLGQMACKSCIGFIQDFMNSPREMNRCNEGNCQPNVKSTTKATYAHWNCEACWLKACLNHFAISPEIIKNILLFFPEKSEIKDLITQLVTLAVDRV